MGAVSQLTLQGFKGIDPSPGQRHFGTGGMQFTHVASAKGELNCRECQCMLTKQRDSLWERILRKARPWPPRAR